MQLDKHVAAIDPPLGMIGIDLDHTIVGRKRVLQAPISPELAAAIVERLRMIRQMESALL